MRGFQFLVLRNLAFVRGAASNGGGALRSVGGGEARLYSVREDSSPAMEYSHAPGLEARVVRKGAPSSAEVNPSSRARRDVRTFVRVQKRSCFSRGRVGVKNGPRAVF